MAANSNVGSTNSGSSRRTSSSGGRAGSVASSLSKTLSAGSNAEVNSSETSSGSFSCMTTTTSSGSEGAVAAVPMETMGSGGGLRRAASVGGKNKKRFVGVRQRPSGRWVAEIKDTTQKIRLWLGTFDTAEDAARAYDEAAWLLRGANTRTNFVPSTSTDVSVLPSKAARLLQLRRNAAAASASSQENSSGAAAAPTPVPASAATPVNSKPPQTQSGTSAGNKLEGNVNPNSMDLSPPKSPHLPSVAVLPSPDSNSKQAASMGSRAPAPPALVTAASAASTSLYDSSNIGHVSNISGVVSKSVSSYESSVEEMCGIEEAPGLNNNGPALFQPDLGRSQRRNDQSTTTIVNVKQELVTSTYQAIGDPSPIRENRKEKYYCSEAPQQESFVDDTDMSSGLSGLEDVDLSCADSVYSSPFDFSADMGPGFLISSPLSADLATGEDDSLTEHMRRMSYERQISAGLYAINGVHECLSLSSHSWGQSSWNGGLSSPSLTMAAGFRRSTSGPFLTGSPAGWKSVGAPGSNGNNGSGSWGTPSQQQQPSSIGPSPVNGNNGTNSAVAENAECPSQDALWQSWDLPPLCVVA